MFNGGICYKKLNSPNLLIRHLKTLHRLAFNNRYVCKQGECIREFQNSQAFKKHLHREHSTREESTAQKSECKTKFPASVEHSNASCSFETNQSRIDFSLPTESIEHSNITAAEVNNLIQTTTAAFVAKLYNNTAIPRSVVQEVIDYSQECYECGFLTILKDKVLKTLNNSNVTDGDKQGIEDVFNLCENPFEDFQTEYKRLKYFKEAGFLIESKSYYIGTVDGTDVEGQYISLENVLKSFFEMPGILDSILDYINYLNNEVDSSIYMSNFVHGELWKEVKEKYPDRILIPCLVNHDAYETNNPLGFHTGTHKLGPVYIILPTLPPLFQSRLRNIFLALLFRDEDRVHFGNRACFQPLLRELIKLELERLTLKNGTRLFFPCVLITGDNLGIQSKNTIKMLKTVMSLKVE